MNFLTLKNIRDFFTRFIKRLGVVFLILIGLFFLANIIFPLPKVVTYSSVITDSKGQLLHAFLSPDEKWRMKTELNEISPLLQQTIIAKEDHWFYWHPGVNPFAVARALVRNTVTGRRTSGASTITMQVARLMHPTKRNMANKLVEMFRAFQLEWSYSKKEILQLYINLLPYGGNIEGVKTASWIYFNKNPDHLSLAEITALSIIPNRPTSLVMGKHNDAIVKERNRWLVRFQQQKVFEDQIIEDALREPLTASRGNIPRVAPHLSLQLKRKNQNLVNIDLNTQLKTEKITSDYINGLKLLNINNAAVVVIENATHKVISYVGSANFFDTTDGGQVNGAMAIRQPGSTLKPLLYGLCIDAGLITPKMAIGDIAINYNGYVPENYDQRFNGFVTMEYALMHSLNIPAVKMLNQLGKEKLISALGEADCNQIKKDEKKLGLSMVLGGCGASLLELTGLFSALAQKGLYTPPVFSTSDIVKSPRQILSPAAAFMVSDILSKINRPDFPINWQATEHLPKIAWKTGTSYGRKDAWSIGYNARYTVGVWVGNFSGLGIPELSGAQSATPLLFKIFNTIDYNTNDNWFVPPAECDVRRVCAETGLPPADFCTDIITDYFIPLTSPNLPCNNHQQIAISADEKISYCVECKPALGFKKKWFRVLAPDMQAYFDEHHLVYDKIPPHNGACKKLFYESGPIIKSPDGGAEYYISKSAPEPLLLQCQTPADVSKVFWYINDRFYKAALPNEKVFYMPTEGPQKISCTDDKGRNRDLRCEVKYVAF